VGHKRGISTGKATAQASGLYLCIKGEIYFKSSAQAEEYFIDQCTGPYGYNLKFCEGLSDHVYTPSPPPKKKIIIIII